MRSVSRSTAAKRSPIKKAAYAASALALGVATVATFGGEQKAQAVPLPELACPLVTATVNYNKGFHSEVIDDFTEAIETSTNIKLGTEANSLIPCVDGRLGIPTGQRVTGGHGTLKATKVGNCELVDVQNAKAEITWTRVEGGQTVNVGTSTITYSASGPIEDTVITSGFVSGGNQFQDDKIVNNSLNDGDTVATLTACLDEDGPGVLTQTGKAQFTLDKF